jgi:phosphohistidine phosphatase SixA
MLGLPSGPPSGKLGTTLAGKGHGEDVPVVYLVRHAHAGRKADWQGPDLIRPLSRQGHLEALGLIDQLRGRSVRRVLSSSTRRCLQTVQPLADLLRLPVEPSDALGVEASGADMLPLLTDPALHQAVLCTHGENIGEVFDELRGVGIQLSDRPRWAKGSTWVIERNGQRWRGTYLEPRSVEPAVADRPPR